MTEPERDTKRRILAAAEAEFLAGGYDRARMQAIADRAQINKAMLHYHFRSKHELFATFIREKADRVFPRAESAGRLPEDFIQFTCGFVDAYFSLLRANPHLPTLLLQVAANHEELLSEIALDFPEKFVAAFTGAAADGRVRPHDGTQFIVSIMGLCVMPFVGKNLIKASMGLDEAAYQVLLSRRADEIKRYVVLLLTPNGSDTKECSNV